MSSPSLTVSMPNLIPSSVSMLMIERAEKKKVAWKMASLPEKKNEIV